MLIASTACASSLWARSRWDRTRLSVVTDEVAATADQAVDFVHEFGLSAVEVRNVPGTHHDYIGSRDAVVQADAAHLVNERVKVVCVQSDLLRFAWPACPPPSVTPDQAHWESRIDDLRKALHCAATMGSDKLRIFAGLRSADPGSALQPTADAISEMAAEAERQKVVLLVENDPATNVATCAEMAALMKLVTSKWVGINWCPFNSRQVELPFPAGYGLLPKKRILNVRAHAQSLVPGAEGEDWKTILVALDKDGYAGKITLETGGAPIATARESIDQLEHIVREVS